MSLLDYATKQTPGTYRCHLCGTSGCKLWREGGTLGLVVLECADCASFEQSLPVENIDERGLSPHPQHSGLTHNIGNRIPAIPTPEGGAYWGHTSTPTEAYAWWKALPTRGMIPMGVYAYVATGERPCYGVVAQTFPNSHVLLIVSPERFVIAQRVDVIPLDENDSAEPNRFLRQNELRALMGLPPGSPTARR